jgi:hypothetical protein
VAELDDDLDDIEALDAAESRELKLLDKELGACRKQLERYDRYYEGEQPLKYMAPALEAEIGDRVTQLVVNFPRMGVEAYEHRMDITGTACPTKSMQKQLDEWWKAIDGKALSELGHTDSLALGRSYAIVGAGETEDDPPVLTIEHPYQVITRRDPKTRRTASGLKRWKEDDGSNWAQLYLPEETITCTRGRSGWRAVERDDHEVGEVLVVPLVNNERVLREAGRPEFQDILRLTDAVNKMGTDMMVAGEFHAMPRRWALGFDEEDFVDEEGKPIDAWSIIAGRIWGSSKGSKDGAEVGQFPEADLRNFHESIRLLATLIGQTLALPSGYMNFVTDNPPSAEGMRASETRMIKRAERKLSALGAKWRQVDRLGLRILTGRFDPKSRLIEVLWRDPATPTRAQAADAAVKLVGPGKAIIPRRQAWDDLDYSPEQMTQMELWFADEERQQMVALAAIGAGVGAGTPPADDDADGG